jgi:hypothetical protein
MGIHTPISHWAAMAQTTCEFVSPHNEAHSSNFFHAQVIVALSGYIALFFGYCIPDKRLRMNPNQFPTIKISPVNIRSRS